jgi:hypothetical protein
MNLPAASGWGIQKIIIKLAASTASGWGELLPPASLNLSLSAAQYNYGRNSYRLLDAGCSFCHITGCWKFQVA